MGRKPRSRSGSTISGPASAVGYCPGAMPVPGPLGVRKIIARRACLELVPGCAAQLGAGLPGDLSRVLREEGTADLFTLAPGGPAGIRFLGFGPDRGDGGKVVFMGPFATGGLRIAVEDNRVRILREGTIPALHRGLEGLAGTGGDWPVLVITERCVFRRAGNRLELVEIAPGVDLDRDILDRLDFAPALARDLGLMPLAIFRPEPMGLRERLLPAGLSQAPV